MADQYSNEVSTCLHLFFSTEVMERLFYWTRDLVVSIITSTERQNGSDSIEDVRCVNVLGAFVSFKKHGRLRSCMGCLTEGIQLALALESAAYSASVRDPRFPPINSNEFYDLNLEVWILGGMCEVKLIGEERKSAVIIGKNGLLIQGRGRKGLLLPNVALDWNWSSERFLQGVCDKAGLSRNAWMDPDIRLFTFEGVAFKKPFVWNVSRNPVLALAIKERQRTELLLQKNKS